MQAVEKRNSGSEERDSDDKHVIPVPKRTFTLELLVGIFMVIGIAAIGYQAMGLAGISVVPTDEYEIFAEFDNISGLEVGAPVEIAGVPVGSVSKIKLKDPEAIVVLRLKKSIQIFDDDIASIRTKGIIGDRYVKLSRGASDLTIEPEGTMMETESVVDIEDIIGKFVHSIGGDDE